MREGKNDIATTTRGRGRCNTLKERLPPGQPQRRERGHALWKTRGIGGLVGKQTLGRDLDKKATCAGRQVDFLNMDEGSMTVAMVRIRLDQIFRL